MYVITNLLTEPYIIDILKQIHMVIAITIPKLLTVTYYNVPNYEWQNWYPEIKKRNQNHFHLKIYSLVRFY